MYTGFDKYPPTKGKTPKKGAMGEKQQGKNKHVCMWYEFIGILIDSSEWDEGDQSKKYEFRFEFPPKFNFDPRKIDDRWGTLASLGLALAAGYLLTRPRENTRHISWQEFKVAYLEKGEVEKLEVINGTLVRGYLFGDGATNMLVSHALTTWCLCVYHTS